MTPRRQAAVALVCLAVLSGGGVAAEEPGASHSDHAAEAHHRHLVSAFVGATHDHGEDAVVYGVAIGRKF